MTVAEDKANGEFRCELFDSNFDLWKRAIEVQVIGKLESATNQEMQYLRGPEWHSLICVNGYVPPNMVRDVHS